MQNEARASNPLYVTIPFVYFQMLAQAYYGQQVEDHMNATPANQKVPHPDPSPMSEFNMKGVELFEEMPPGWKSLRKRNENGK
jgi:hypothetical protein